MCAFEEKFQKIKKQVLSRIKPGKADLENEKKFAQSLVEKIKSIEGRHADVIVAGSSARGTHLKNDRDIDVFVLFPKEFPREDFVKEGLRIAKLAFKGHEWEQAFSEHPYIRGCINGYEVEIVPSYKVEHAFELKSSVDRTPFHNSYLLQKLSDAQKDEARLLKQFLKGIGCYGAELKYNSVPGYVTELLILNYGDFLSCIKAAAKWKMNEVIDLEKYYLAKDAVKRFNSHLIIVDPVDLNRNVAAALSYNQYARMIAASREFLKRPSPDFFFGKKHPELSGKKLREILAKKELVAVCLGYPKNALADIIWGQAKRMQRKIANQLFINDFIVNRHEFWTDERSMLLLLFELESLSLQKVKKKAGPEVVEEEHSRNFLAAHKDAVAGPRIEDGRWIIEIERKYLHADDFMKAYLKELQKSEKKPILTALKKGGKILDEAAITRLYSSDKGFREFLSRYLSGKERFL